MPLDPRFHGDDGVKRYSAFRPERGHGYRRAVSLCSRRGLPGLTAGIIESPCYPPWGQLEIHSWGGDSFCFAAGLRWPLLWQRPGVRRELAQGVNRGLPGNDAIPNGDNAFAVNLGLRCAWRQPTTAGSLCEFVALDQCAMRAITLCSSPLRVGKGSQWA